MLLSGLERVEVTYGNYSERSRQRGLKITSIRITCPNGMQFSVDVNDCMSSDVTPQPNNFGYYGDGNPITSIVDAIKRDRERGENVEIHGQFLDLEVDEYALAV